MSYILDALKRAESERSRGAVPGVHAQPQAATHPAAKGHGGVVWIAAGVIALALVGALVWWFAGRGAAPVPPPVVAAVAPAEVSAPRVQEPSPPLAPAVERPAAVLPPIPVVPAVPAIPVAPAVPVVSPLPAPAQATQPAPGPKAPAATKVPAEQPRVSPLAELPDTVRQQLPALAISGATYSENPQYRMVIVNGQVLHEGDTAAPGVVLDTIRPKDVVLRVQGYRFAMKY